MNFHGTSRATHSMRACPTFGNCMRSHAPVKNKEFVLIKSTEFLSGVPRNDALTLVHCTTGCRNISRSDVM